MLRLEKKKEKVELHRTTCYARAEENEMFYKVVNRKTYTFVDLPELFTRIEENDEVLKRDLLFVFQLHTRSINRHKITVVLSEPKLA